MDTATETNPTPTLVSQLAEIDARIAAARKDFRERKLALDVECDKAVESLNSERRALQAAGKAAYEAALKAAQDMARACGIVRDGASKPGRKPTVVLDDATIESVFGVLPTDATQAMRASQIRESLGMDEDTLRRAMHALRESGRVVKIGEAAGAKYVRAS